MYKGASRMSWMKSFGPATSPMAVCVDASAVPIADCQLSGSGSRSTTARRFGPKHIGKDMAAPFSLARDNLKPNGAG